MPVSPKTCQRAVRACPRARLCGPSSRGESPWVCVAQDPPSFQDTVIADVTARLGDPESINGYRAEDLAVGRRISYDVKANWKLIIENFMECYHCATIHP
jgi:hypothetical protein